MSSDEERKKVRLRGLADAAFASHTTARTHAAFVATMLEKHGSEAGFSERLNELAVSNELRRTADWINRKG